eukprot:6174986-Pleurochrysis_carterae.AAC.4
MKRRHHNAREAAWMAAQSCTPMSWTRAGQTAATARISIQLALTIIAPVRGARPRQRDDPSSRVTDKTTCHRIHIGTRRLLRGAQHRRRALAVMCFTLFLSCEPDLQLERSGGGGGAGPHRRGPSRGALSRRLCS